MDKTANNDKLRELLAIGDAAKYLGVSIDTLRRWEKRGKVVPLRSPGGHRYFEKDVLDELFGTKYTREEEVKSRVKYQVEEKPISQLPKNNTVDLISQPIIEIPIIKPVRLTALDSEPPPPPPPLSANQNQISQTQTFLNKEDKKETQEIKIQAERKVPEKEIAKKDLSLQEEQRLDEILFNDKKEKQTNKTLLVIIAVIIFAILDVILFLLWRKPSTILSPVP